MYIIWTTKFFGVFVDHVSRGNKYIWKTEKKEELQKLHSKPYILSFITIKRLESFGWPIDKKKMYWCK